MCFFFSVFFSFFFLSFIILIYFFLFDFLYLFSLVFPYTSFSSFRIRSSIHPFVILTLFSSSPFEYFSYSLFLPFLSPSPLSSPLFYLPFILYLILNPLLSISSLPYSLLPYFLPLIHLYSLSLSCPLISSSLLPFPNSPRFIFHYPLPLSFPSFAFS